MSYRILSLILCTAIFIAGCSSREQVKKAIYDGLTAREKIKDPSPDPIPKEYPSYNAYKLEREKILNP